MDLLPNPRILLVDDSLAIHEDFRKILCADGAGDAIAAQEASLFGEQPPPRPQFELDSAYQGREALALILAAGAAGRPYALAFVDMRMPPGWDGMETVQRLWQADPRLQVVICTAYSDHAWEDVLERLDGGDRLLVLKKPFDMIEVSQLARTLTAKWSLARRSELQTGELESAVQRLRASERALRHTSGELEAFAHSISHDLRSPLARVVAFSGLLTEELDRGGAKARHYLERIRSNAGVAEALMDGLLRLTHIARAPLRVSRLEITPLVQQMVWELQDASPDRKARVQVQPGLALWADAWLMPLAIRNLVENAWKFSSRREQTAIEVGQAGESGGQCVYFVRDNGCGFDMAHAGRLFQNFQRLHEADEYPGTGVGLVTVGRVVARHGGRVWAESVLGEGSTFYFSLPCPPAAADNAQAQPMGAE
jgi:signal transduction histidine kinase